METKQLYEQVGNEYKPINPSVSLNELVDKESDLTFGEILSKYNHLKVNWKGDASSTRNEVPIKYRRNGLYITYNNGTDVVTEYYVGSNNSITTETWTADSNWKTPITEEWINANINKLKPARESVGYEQLTPALRQLVNKNTNVTNCPDDEDLTSQDNLLKFKDREYDADNFSGKGYVILRKNVKKVNKVTKNILEQSMINKENTIYEIRYDFDLNGEEITVPEGCILKFEGGMLRNGTVNGNGTKIANAIEAFSYICFTGKYNCLFNIAWLVDHTEKLQEAFIIAQKAFDGIELLNGETYNISDTIDIYMFNFKILGNGSIIKFNTDDINKVLFNCIAKRGYGIQKGLYIEDLTLNSKIQYSTLTSYGICFQNTNQIILNLNNVTISNFYKALDVTALIESHFNRCHIAFNTYGLITRTSNIISTTIFFISTYFHCNKKAITFEADSLTDIHFNNVIFESASHYNILDYGMNNLIDISNCYFENNSTGYDWNGSYSELSEVRENIYENVFEDTTLQNVQKAKNCVLSISNSFISGSNNLSKIGQCIKTNLGCIYLDGNKITRFKNIISLSDKIALKRKRYTIYVTSFNFYSSDIKLFNDITLLNSSLDSINVFFEGNNLSERLMSNFNLVGYANNNIDEGFINGYGYKGAEDNTKAIRIEGKNVLTVNKLGCTVLGGQINHSILNFNSAGICIIDNDNISNNKIELDLMRLLNNKDVDKIVYIRNVKGQIVALTGILDDKNASTYSFGYIHPMFVVTDSSKPKLEETREGNLLYNKTSKKIEFWDGIKWCNINGYDSNISNVGPTVNRPILNNNDVAFQYFDTTLNKAIWWTGEKWIDAIGADV